MHMERSAVNKNRCIALKDWDRLCVHAKHHQTGGLETEWDKINVPSRNCSGLVALTNKVLICVGQL